MQLEPLYRATFETPESWTVDLTDDERYGWLNDVVGALAGEVRPRADGGFEVAYEVSQLVWAALP